MAHNYRPKWARSLKVLQFKWLIAFPQNIWQMASKSFKIWHNLCVKYFIAVAAFIWRLYAFPIFFEQDYYHHIEYLMK